MSNDQPSVPAALNGDMISNSFLDGGDQLPPAWVKLIREKIRAYNARHWSGHSLKRE